MVPLDEPGIVPVVRIFDLTAVDESAYLLSLSNAYRCKKIPLFGKFVLEMPKT